MTFAGKYPKLNQDDIYQPNDNIVVEDLTA